MSTISPNRLRKIKEQLDSGKSHYGQWTWSLDTTWMDDELMMDWLMDGCFPLFYLITYLVVYWKSCGKFPAFYFSGKVTTLIVGQSVYRSLGCGSLFVTHFLLCLLDTWATMFDIICPSLLGFSLHHLLATILIPHMLSSNVLNFWNKTKVISK